MEDPPSNTSLWFGSKGVPNWRKKEEILALMSGTMAANAAAAFDWQSAVVLIDAQAHHNLSKACNVHASADADDRKEDAA